FTWARCSRARGQPIYRWCNQPSSNWRSISRPQRPLGLDVPQTLLAIADEVIAYPSVSRLWRREFANQRPPDFLFVLNERLGLLGSVVPDRHAEVRVAFFDRQRVERLAKSVGETALDRLWDPSWRGKRHESDGADARIRLRNGRDAGIFGFALRRHLTNQLKVAGLQRATQSKHTFDSAVNATAHDVRHRRHCASLVVGYHGDRNVCLLLQHQPREVRQCTGAVGADRDLS